MVLLISSFEFHSFYLQLLKPAEQTVSFTELTVKKGFEANKRGIRSFVIGVDARYI
jgi:hypothetical protein